MLPTVSTPDTIAELRSLFDGAGSALYFGEAVTEREHALQAAHLAAQEGAGNDLIIAALLHDVGHLLHGMGEHVADVGIDAHHELVGHAWMSQRFPPAISEPGRLHVAAKRYLCSKQSGYLAKLSPASAKSLELQGGPMSSAEVEEFEVQPFWQNALRVRAWDDRAKITGWDVPPFEAYTDQIRKVMK
ncbi:MAG: metal-dependent phosphohydrolase [Planctomycetota bacterium]